MSSPPFGASAYATLPTVAMATKAVLGEDLLAGAGIDWKAYMKLLGERNWWLPRFFAWLPRLNLAAESA